MTTATTAERAAIASAAFVLLLLAVSVFPNGREPSFVPPVCGTVVEEGEAVPASCSSLAELDAAVARVRAEQTGGRFEEGYDECAELLAADDTDAGTCWTKFPGLDAPESWGPDHDPETDDVERDS